MKRHNIVLVSLLTFVVGYVLGTVTGPFALFLLFPPSTDTVSVPAEVGGVVDETGSAIVDTVPATGFTIDVAGLPSAQQTALRAVGIEDTLTITPAQVECAVAQVGAARVEAIKAGAAPTLLEATKLAACL